MCSLVPVSLTPQQHIQTIFFHTGNLYIKNIGEEKRLIYCQTSEDIRNACQELCQLGPLTCAYEIFTLSGISIGHVTISFLGSFDLDSDKFNPNFNQCVEALYQFITKYGNIKLEVIPYGKSQFGQQSVVIARFDTELEKAFKTFSLLGSNLRITFGPKGKLLVPYNKCLFRDLQNISKLGLQEDPSKLTKHYYHYSADESDEKRKVFNDTLVSELPEMSEEEISDFVNRLLN